MKIRAQMKKYGTQLVSVVALSTLMVGHAFAYIDQTAVTAGITELTDDATWMQSTVFPFAILVTGLGIGISLFKKFSRKAAS